MLSTALSSVSMEECSSQYSKKTTSQPPRSQSVPGRVVHGSQRRMEVRGAEHCSEAAACDCRMSVAAELAGGHSAGHSEVMPAEWRPEEEDSPSRSGSSGYLSQPTLNSAPGSNSLFLPLKFQLTFWMSVQKACRSQPGFVRRSDESSSNSFLLMINFQRS